MTTLTTYRMCNKRATFTDETGITRGGTVWRIVDGWADLNCDDGFSYILRVDRLTFL